MKTAYNILVEIEADDDKASELLIDDPVSTLEVGFSPSGVNAVTTAVSVSRVI